MARGFGLTSTPEIEVLAAYAAPQDTVAAVAESPGWYVVGAFRLESTAFLRLELIGLVSHASLTMRARLFDLEAVAEVASMQASLNSLVDTRALSARVELTGNRIYQIQVEVTGSAGADRFGVVRSAAPTV
jgi:hypothetical protein